ncbi:MAG: hypothetical protein AABX46_03280, partial [Thermoproteota archaeon]
MKLTQMSARLNTISTIKLTMTNIKQILILPVLVMLISIVGLSAQNAMAVSSTISDQITCESPSVGGVWTSMT